MDQAEGHPGEAATATDADRDGRRLVRHFRQSLLWPIRVSTRDLGLSLSDAMTGPGSPWKIHSDEFEDPAQFCERHYSELVTFLPPVRRFLFGKGGSAALATEVLRRSDVARIRLTLSGGVAPVVLNVAHIDLYIFAGIGLAMLNVELTAEDIELDRVQDIMFEFGRLYPGKWTEGGAPLEIAQRVELLDAAGGVMAASDYGDRTRYLAFACQNRAPLVAAHWNFLVAPLVQRGTDDGVAHDYKLLEGDRLAQMAFVGMHDANDLTRGDYIRLAFASGAGDSGTLPFAERHLQSFEADYCYDRYDEPRGGAAATSLRFMASEGAFVVAGPWREANFQCGERGYLGQFRHQQFLLFMIAHFQKAALLMFSDRMAGAVNMLDIDDPKAVLAFRTATRAELARFLRFTHKYWFHNVSSHELDKELFALCRRHLALDEMYEDVRAEIEEMSQFLEAEAMRRQNDTMMRLTVVTIIGLIMTIATGFLGMNLFDYTALTPLQKTIVFAVVLVPTVAMMVLAARASRGLSAILDRMSNSPVRRTGEVTRLPKDGPR